MSPLAKPSLRLSAASVASGLSKKDIRNWLDRGILHLFSEQEHGWTEFSHADIAMLALAEKLTSVSVPAAQACRIARALIEDTGLTAGRVALPALALSGAFTLKAVMVWPEAGDLRHQLIQERELMDKPHRTRPAAIILRPAQIIAAAILSLEEPIANE